ncbi:MAG: hypothetical protein VB933_03265 [Pseudomonadales bacterium]
MKLIKKTDEYIVYLKRSGRYGVKNTDRKWVNGVSKTRILLAEGLVKTTLPPEPEANTDETADDAEVAVSSDTPAAEDDSSEDIGSESRDSVMEEPEAAEPANQEEESVSATNADVTDSSSEETVNESDDEDIETSDASDTSEDAGNPDIPDEEDPEQVADEEGKEP